ncbi:MFS transporter [Lichenicoccus sp.]|uniref:MFS transporter n=1 Tax=Lichenicoccus sp. TaxID=2781899 RepID=UPI003D0D0FFB
MKQDKQFDAIAVAAPDEIVDISKALDEAPVGRLMIQVGILCGAVALLDGTDTTSIGVAAPLILHHLRLSQAHLGPIFSSALFGAMLGALSFGTLADRFGRKSMLVIATLIFGVFTAATAFAGSLQSLLAIRFFLGLGLGGAAPCFIALASEYAPSSHRELVAGLIWTAFPLGVIVGAVLNAYILSHAHWPAIFLVGGVLPLMICVALMIWLPESLRFLLVRRPGSARIRQIVSKQLPLVSSSARLVSGEASTVGPSMRGLSLAGRGLETLFVWISFMAAFGMTAATFFWSPIFLHNHGFTLPAASMIVGVGAGVGSLLGAAGAGRLMEKFGSTATLATTFLLATLTTATLGYASLAPVPMVVDVIANGVLLAGISTAGMLALAADLYPTAMRSTGVGWAMGAGRLGEVLLPLLIGVLIGVSGEFGKEVFLTIACAPFLGALSILGLRWHSLRSRTAGRLSVSG